MSFQKNPQSSKRLFQVIGQTLDKAPVKLDTFDRPWWLVDVFEQRLILVQGREPQDSWSVSTAAAGLDNRQDSGGTPPGLHRIARKIGEGSPVGTVFSSREPTGETWQPHQELPDDLILTRILTLRGAEPGLNLGPGVDTEERYIYLHGTNHEDGLGEPVSHGCVRLANADVCQVFDLAAEGDHLVIV